MLENNDIQAILGLIGRANITGQEATPVAILIQKLQGMLKKDEPKSGDKNSSNGK